MSILITGGAGFIGSHSAKFLAESGLEVVVLDNLVTGRIENARWGRFVRGDISDIALLRHVIRDREVSAVLHLAASAHMGESMARPDAYFSNNITGSLTLFEAMLAEGVRTIVFASSCSVYGNPQFDTVRENEGLRPLSPYGESKLTIERLLPWYEGSHGLRWVALRYFNAAGAESNLGEDPEHSVRIVPRAIHAAIGGGPPIQVYGTQYPTRDGTAVRDFVHVSDIAYANRLALEYVAEGNPGVVINIGTGLGISVRQIIDAVGSVARCAVPFVENMARPGDVAGIIADASRARDQLGWEPSRSDLTRIITTAMASYLRRTGVDDAIGGRRAR
jgi:UDP-arabinose 4-epimerase